MTVMTIWGTEEVQCKGAMLFSCSVLSSSLQHHVLQHTKASLSFTISQSLLKLMSVMQSNHLILCRPLLLLLLFFPASGCYPVSQLIASGGQSIGVSASAFPMNIQDWFPLQLTGLISLPSKGLSRVFSNTTVQKPQFILIFGKTNTIM